jgi:hypothetical protein
MSDSKAGGQVLFEEVQDAPWPLTLVGLGAGAAGGLALTRALTLIARFGAAALLIGGVSVALREFLIPFRIRLYAEELVLEYGKRQRYRIRTRHIMRAYQRTYHPLREFGGWGIRGKAENRAFTFRGTDGVQIELRSGKKVLVGSQQAEGLAAAIRALTGCAGLPGQPLVTIRESPPSDESDRSDTSDEADDSSGDWAGT